MRPTPWDESQPHHVVTREDEYGRESRHCSCGKGPVAQGDTGHFGWCRVSGKLVLVDALRRHVEDHFDGRCHFKRYGMECGRYYGHRGLHREAEEKGSFSALRARLLAHLP